MHVKVFPYLFLLIISIGLIHIIEATFLNPLNKFSQHSNHETLAVRETKIETGGYWNYLLGFGLWGRVLHFLITDTNAFQREIRQLDRYFKYKYGAEQYKQLEKEVAESFPIFDALFHLQEISQRVSSVRDPITKKTLGHALNIFKNIAYDANAKKEFIARWNMIDNLPEIFKENRKTAVLENNEARSMENLKITLLEHPELFSKLIADSEIFSHVSGAIRQSLKDFDYNRVMTSIEKIITEFQSRNPEQFEEIKNKLSAIKDEKTQLSFTDSILSLMNIMKNPQFKRIINDVLDKETLKEVSAESQDIVPQYFQTEDLETEDESPLMISPEIIQNMMIGQGIEMPMKEVEETIHKAKDGTLIEETLKFLKDVESRPGGITPQQASKVLKEMNVDMSPTKVSEMADILSMLPSEDMAVVLMQFGINVPVAKIEELHTLITPLK